ncbi:hypothetical protein BV898_03205 [Hypsibius exemplaris]|uniref:Uncharacterized protein n=1 Tax=Hypsibius exemplaris TaxID=2072580 RepID=A0A1W0X5U5_HYPEX|nr:hypothetical protein BV898_03205 [Hypsibius exemplaris]
MRTARTLKKPKNEIAFVLLNTFLPNCRDRYDRSLERVMTLKRFLVLRFVADKKVQIFSPDELDNEPFILLPTTEGLKFYGPVFRIVRATYRGDKKQYNAEFFAIAESQGDASSEAERVRALAKPDLLRQKVMAMTTGISFKTANTSSIIRPGLSTMRVDTSRSRSRAGSNLSGSVNLDSSDQMQGTEGISTKRITASDDSIIFSTASRCSSGQVFAASSVAKESPSHFRLSIHHFDDGQGAAGKPVFIYKDLLQRLTTTVVTRSHLATTLAKHLLGGEEGILYYGANKPLGQGIVALHPDMVHAINTYIHSDKVKLNGPPLISIGQAINGTLNKEYK